MADQSESQFRREVAEVLLRSGFLVREEAAIGGLRPDFLVTTPEGRTIVVEAKRWRPDQAHIQRAKEQVELYKQATNADSAYIVMSGLERGNPSEGIFTLHELADEIAISGKGDTEKRGDNLFRYDLSSGPNPRGCPGFARASHRARQASRAPRAPNRGNPRLVRWHEGQGGGGATLERAEELSRMLEEVGERSRQ
jgi:hypothetical protein